MQNPKWYGMHQCDNRIWLKRLIKHFGLTRPQVAKHLMVDLSTVDRWLASEDLKSHRAMPNIARKLLTYIVNSGEIEKKVD